MEGMAAWVAEQCVQENVQIQQHGSEFWVPCGQSWTVKGEVKNVITVVAKTTHYFAEHISNDMKTTMIVQEGLSKVGALIKGLFGDKSHERRS